MWGDSEGKAIQKEKAIQENRQVCTYCENQTDL